MDQTRFSNLILNKLKQEISPAEEQELQVLVSSNEVYAKQYRFFIEYWNDQETDNTNSQRLFNDLRLRIEAEEQKKTLSLRPSRRSSLPLAAASIALVLTAGVFYFKWPASQQLRSAAGMSTSVRSQKTITLEDGTTVRLNGNSSLSMPRMAAHKREITLTGEAYFDVAKDHKRPFTIHTDKMDILVLGTAFNVRAYPGEQQQQTALIHGAIKVTLHDRHKSVIYLKPNDKLIIDETEKSTTASAGRLTYNLGKLEHYDAADTTAIMETAWIENHLVFRDQPFETLANQLEIRYGTPVIFHSEHAKKYRFNGTFKKENLQEVLYILSRTGTPFAYEFKEGKVYIN
ncbi:putative anti-sigma factor [Pedobacter sp. BAL39]|uniref:FecR family protein n=1 Tax=Pedobacter sp. BAL39 TaxID=391596 RepID=UPI000155AA00|nr:FecR family protein [Pedobacter sp. BAL39]EDM34665.1 putative anti-sigma factor [Pedobacter sp. BAL39]